MVEAKTALSKPTFITMKDLEPGTRVNMHLRVDSVTVTKQHLGWDEGLTSIGLALVGDEHGCCKLQACGAQLDTVKAGQTITIRNAHANVVKEHLLIEIDKWAKVETCKLPVTAQINKAKNHSDIEYELVSVKA